LARSFRYSTSKLFLLYAVQEIAERSPITPDSDVILVALTPGMCHSNLFREDKPWLHSIVERGAMRLLARSASTGGGTLVNAIRPNLLQDAHGAFLMDEKVAE